MHQVRPPAFQSDLPFDMQTTYLRPIMQDSPLYFPAKPYYQSLPHPVPHRSPSVEYQADRLAVPSPSHNWQNGHLPPPVSPSNTSTGSQIFGSPFLQDSSTFSSDVQMYNAQSAYNKGGRLSRRSASAASEQPRPRLRSFGATLSRFDLEDEIMASQRRLPSPLPAAAPLFPPISYGPPRPEQANKRRRCDAEYEAREVVEGTSGVTWDANTFSYDEWVPTFPPLYQPGASAEQAYIPYPHQMRDVSGPSSKTGAESHIGTSGFLSPLLQDSLGGVPKPGKLNLPVVKASKAPIKAKAKPRAAISRRKKVTAGEAGRPSSDLDEAISSLRKAQEKVRGLPMRGTNWYRIASEIEALGKEMEHKINSSTVPSVLTRPGAGKLGKKKGRSARKSASIPVQSGLEEEEEDSENDEELAETLRRLDEEMQT